MMNSMLGALVGDAAGATLEFYPRKITEEMTLNAMKMPGGGSLRVGPGQITDDGELTLSLWRALSSNSSNNNCIEDIPIEDMINAYFEWYDSIPFDIGRTCGLAFEALYDYKTTDKFKNINECKKFIKAINEHSEANGATMRASAIPTWTVKYNKSVDVAVKCAIEDAKLSHPSIICQEVNAIYVFAITHLLQGKTPRDTLTLTEQFIKTHIISDKVKTWFFDESLDISKIDVTNQIGHVRWGFVLAIYFLRHPEISYEEAIKITLMKGGDTDTNAAIVGGMVGAYRIIPEYMIKPVLDFDCTIEGRRCPIRPAQYSVKNVLGNLI